ncbi:4,5-dihydroxyphthalate decarboxylase [Acuticoccus kandeliae]|uniref:4,5-dihydroxyphthalate decarboxylase n=1 Tax=Acuticoccus kandeliae TaxID=2073160 RepID=UPI000D3E386E|nr:4,5-dihydroxyphthalate decarboxylase [Acuticoccus kandeliae]
MTTLTFAVTDTDRSRPLIDGTVRPEGFTLAPIVLPPSEIFPRAAKDAPFEVCEFSASTHAIQVARGEANYVAIPVFLSRAFRLNAIYVRTDRGIDGPKDLEGRCVGVPEYQMTLAVWLRGILADHFGVDLSTMRTRTGGIDTPGRVERIALALPPEIDCAPIPEGATLSAMLADGSLDAVMSPRPPQCFRDGHPDVRRLFPRPALEEERYYGATGMFPIMHLVGIRRDVAARHPNLAPALFAAFEAARRTAHAALAAMVASPVLPLSLPFLSDHLDETRRIMGRDFWPYGFERNAAELQALCRYLLEQHLIPRPITAEELFVDTL